MRKIATQQTMQQQQQRNIVEKRFNCANDIME